MTDEEQTILEAFEKIREHSSPLVLPLLLSLERMWQFDRTRLELAKVQMAMLTGGDVVLAGNDQHSRRVGDLHPQPPQDIRSDTIGTERRWHA